MKMRSRWKYVSASAMYAVGAVILLALFSELWRFLLLLFMNDQSAHIPGGVLLNSFIIGLRFDLCIASAVVLPIFVIAAIPGIDISRSKIIRRICQIIFGVLAAVIFIIHLVDIEFYSFFKVRLNGSALLWQDTPGDVFSLIWESYPVIKYMILYILMLGTFLWLMRLIMKFILKKTKSTRTWVNLIYIPLIVLLLVLGAVGRIHRTAPMRWGLAFHSEYEFANQLTLNPVYTFMRDIFYDAGHREHIHSLVKKIETPDADDIVRRMIGAPDSGGDQRSDRIVRHVHFENQNPDPPNVIVIIGESFGSSKIGCLKSKFNYDLTPGFDSLVENGVIFTDFYSNGTHTCTGLFAVTTGMPHLFGRTMIKQVPGYNSFYSLPEILRDKGYETIFCTTQDPHFDNMQGFLRSNGIQTIYSQFDHDQTLSMGWLGVPDHIMFDQAYEQLRKRAEEKQKFFALLLTASNHPPCRVPDVGLAPLPEDEKRRNEFEAIRYADWALSRFFYQVRNDGLFDNTIFVFTADNGFPYDVVTELDLSWIQIPLFIYNTNGSLKAGTRDDRIGSQIDILSTVMGQVGLDYDNYSFGKDLFDSTAPVEDFAFSSSWYNVGFIQDGCYLVASFNDIPPALYRVSDKTMNISSEYPDLVQSMRRKAYAIYQSAFYNQQRPLNKLKMTANGE